MAYQKKVSEELVYDLINEANPDLPTSATATNVRLGTPTALAGTPWPALNTKIELSGVPGSMDYIGRRNIQYRRWDLSAMFRGVVVQVRKHTEASLGSATNVMFTVYQLLNDINTKYGILLTERDVSDVNILRGNTQEDGRYTTSVQVTAKATSLGFTGSFTLKWVDAKKSLSDMITVQEIPGRKWPGGNDFSGYHKDIVSTAGFGIDCSAAIKTAYPSLTDNPVDVTLPSNEVWTALVNGCLALVNARAGTSYNVSNTGNYQTQPNNLSGMTLNVRATANVESANAVDFNRVMIIAVPADCTWAAGTFYFHYNYPL